MFGKTSHGYRNIQVQERTLKDSYGDTYIAEFKLLDTSNEENNKLYLVKFQTDDQILNVPDKVKFIGIPGVNGFKTTDLIYVGVNKYTLMNIACFNSRLNNIAKHWDPDELSMILGRSAYDARTFLHKHINGNLISFGYDKDHRKWRLLSDIYNQAAVGDVVNYRVLMRTHPQKILKKLNEKFPTGKKG